MVKSEARISHSFDLAGNARFCEALALKMAFEMSVETFVIAFHEGYWRIGYAGRWYGTYPEKANAEIAAVRIAKAAPELAARVVVQDEDDGSERIIWDPN